MSNLKDMKEMENKQKEALLAVLESAPKNGILSDDELENVHGGLSYRVTIVKCKLCGWESGDFTFGSEIKLETLVTKHMAIHPDCPADFTTSKQQYGK